MAGQAYWSFYGQELAGVSAGDRVTFTGQVYDGGEEENPGGFDFRAYLYQSGMSFGVYGVEDWAAEPGPFDLACLMARVRKYLTQRLCAVMGQEDGAYAAAMLLGEKSLLDQEERQAFSRLGVAHILAVSGFHVGVLAKVLEAPHPAHAPGQAGEIRRDPGCPGRLLPAHRRFQPHSAGHGALGAVRPGRLCHRRGDPLTLLSAAAGLSCWPRRPADGGGVPAELRGHGGHWPGDALAETAALSPGAGVPLGMECPVPHRGRPDRAAPAPVLVVPAAAYVGADGQPGGVSLGVHAHLPVSADHGDPGHPRRAGNSGRLGRGMQPGHGHGGAGAGGVPGAYLWTARPGPLGWLGAGGILASVSKQELVAQAYPLPGGRYGGAVLCGVGDACVTAHHHLDAAERGHRRRRNIGDRRRGLGH